MTMGDIILLVSLIICTFFVLWELVNIRANQRNQWEYLTDMIHALFDELDEKK